jgi:opacity protein-like surface antigen
MTKSFIMGLVFCFAATGALHAEVQFGLKGGLGISDISVASSISKSSRTGLQFGGVIIQKISDNFSMQYEALYSQKGFVESQSLSGVDYKFETNLDYLEVPVLAKFKLDKTWSVYAGGYAAFAMSKKLRVKTSANSSTTETDRNDDFTNSLDYGLLLGAQAKIHEKWILEARYNLGLADTLKVNKSTVDSKNNTISLAATYLL